MNNLEIIRNYDNYNINVNTNVNQHGYKIAYAPQYNSAANQSKVSENCNIISNNASIDKKTYPADIDMLFDSEFMKESNLANMPNDSADNNGDSKNHFDFVNDMMKPNKFR